MTTRTKSPLTRLLKKKLKTYFATGLLVVAPIGLTILVVQAFVSWIDNLLYRVLPPALQPDIVFGVHLPGFGLLTSLLLILMVGVLTANFLGRAVLVYSEKLMYKIPLVRSIYALFKQVADTTFGKERKGFREVILIEYPRKEIWTIGFVTGVTEGEIQLVTGRRVINVFVPTTPNPTSGFLLMVPEEDTIPLTMSVDDAFKLIISGGMAVPKEKEPSGRLAGTPTPALEAPAGPETADDAPPPADPA